MYLNRIEGHPRTPQKGGCPFEPRSRFVKLTPKGVSPPFLFSLKSWVMMH